jgi:UDP-3-O-[3-hydroxymyristoyl] glucosamine N-acyltransferase
MPDPRFFEDLGPVRLGELAALTGAELADAGAASAGPAWPCWPRRPDSVTFLADRKYAQTSPTAGRGPASCRRARGRRPGGCAVLATPTRRRPMRWPPSACTGPAGRGQRRAPDAVLEADVVLARRGHRAGAQIGRGTGSAPTR